MHFPKIFQIVPFLLLLTLVYQQILAQQIDPYQIHDVKEPIKLEMYLKQVSTETGYRFFYSKGLLDEIEVKPWDNEKLLVDYFQQSLSLNGITYLLYKHKNFVLVSKRQLMVRGEGKMSIQDSEGNYYSQITIGDPLLSGKFKKSVITGVIRNGSTGEPLPGAVISANNKTQATITNPNGEYLLELPVGVNEVTFSFFGFENREISIDMISPGNLDIELFEKSIAINQVTITSKSNANIEGTVTSIVRMDAKTISSIPVMLGEPDVMKAMTLMPGVQSSGEMASGFNVRGGNTDQNLILIDGVPIYNTTHLFGMFSVIDTRSIENLELYKGGAPASYGGRASSIMDIKLKEGDNEHFEGIANIGINSSKVNLQGPLLNKKLSYIIGGRMTYSDYMLRLVDDPDIRNSKANFQDVNLKLNYIPNAKNRINFFIYGSNDVFNFLGEQRYQYGNKAGSIRWNHIYNEKITSSINFYLSDYSTQIVDNQNIPSAYSYTSGIRQYGSKVRFLYTPGFIHSLEFGFEANSYLILSGDKKRYGSESTAAEKFIQNKKAADLALYFLDEFKLGDKLSISVGLRYSGFFQMGPDSVNQYSELDKISGSTLIGVKVYENNNIVKQFGNFEPRLGLGYSLTNSSSVKFGYSRNAQYLHMVSNSSVVTPADVWTPSGTYIHPAISNQLVLGFFKNLKGGIIEASSEIYYKHINNMLEYKDGATLFLNKNLEQDLLSANLNAYGIEFLLKKNAGKMTGWISYTYSRSYLQTSGADSSLLINGGGKYSSYFDKPNDLSVVFNYKLTRRFTFGSTFLYSTGRPATFPEKKYLILGADFVEFSDRNKYRQKDYHRLDLSLVWDISLKKKRKTYSTITFSVYNVYGRNNVYSTFYKKDYPTSKNDYRNYALYELSIIGAPIPSITYNLKF